MESIHKVEQKSSRKIKTSSQLFGVGAAMFVAAAAMVAVGGTYGGMIAGFMSGTAFALGISKRKQGN